MRLARLAEPTLKAPGQSSRLAPPTATPGRSVRPSRS